MTGLHSHGLCTASASTFSVAIRGMTMPCSSSLCLSKLPNREAQHGRLPTFCSMVTNTFWFDKACIRQDNIGDGLRVLPINLAACTKMLVVIGGTYATRLWCVWELCTVFAFSDCVGDVSSRIVLAPLGEGMVETLERFSLDHARCYGTPRACKHIHEQ